MTLECLKSIPKNLYKISLRMTLECYSTFMEC